MNRLSYLSILLLCNFNLYGQGDTLTDCCSFKQGYWIVYGKDKPDKGYCDTCIIEEGNYLHDRKNGVWIKYFKTGIPRLEGTYVNGRPNGPYKKFYEDGVISEEGNYSRRLIGDFIRYYPNGQIDQMKRFDDRGIQIDTAYFFFENGCLQKKWIYDPPGALNREIRYYPDSCNEIEGVYEVSGMEAITIGCTFNPIPDLRSPLFNFDGNCEYYTELDNAEDGYNEIYDSEEKLIIEGKVEGGELIKGFMYCYHEEDTKVYKYRNGKVIKHYWIFGEVDSE